MTRNPRRLIVRFISRPNNGPSRELFPLGWSAELECGHVLDMGVSEPGGNYSSGGPWRPKKRMACNACRLEQGRDTTAHAEGKAT